MNSGLIIDDPTGTMADNGLNEKYFFTAADVKNILGVSRATAYKEIRRLNEELSKKGYITVSGRVPAKYFMERLYC